MTKTYVQLLGEVHGHPTIDEQTEDSKYKAMIADRLKSLGYKIDTKSGPAVTTWYKMSHVISVTDKGVWSATGDDKHKPGSGHTFTSLMGYIRSLKR